MCATLTQAQEGNAKLCKDAFTTVAVGKSYSMLNYLHEIASKNMFSEKQRQGGKEKDRKSQLKKLPATA